MSDILKILNQANLHNQEIPGRAGKEPALLDRCAKGLFYQIRQ